MRNGPCVVFLHPISLPVCGVFTKILHCGYLAMHGRDFFVLAVRSVKHEQPLLTARGRLAKSARCRSPRLSRRFAKRAMEQWTLLSQGTIAFYLHTLRYCSSFFYSSCFCFAHAVVCLMFPVFLAWHCVLPFLSALPPGLFDTLEAGTCARSRACCFFFVFPFVFLDGDVLNRILTAREEFLFKGPVKL